MKKTSVMNDDDSPGILERQTTPTTEPVISLKAMHCHGLVNSLFQSLASPSLEIHCVCSKYEKCFKGEQCGVLFGW